jgi:hypothetical protein
MSEGYTSDDGGEALCGGDPFAGGMFWALADIESDDDLDLPSPSASRSSGYRLSPEQRKGLDTSRLTNV